MKTINSELFKEMLIGGVNNLQLRVKEINDLNVFPVPDGDTGTNMHVTLVSAKEEIKKLKKDTSLEEIAAVFSRSSLLSASGNSGVILSQFLKGLSVGVQGKKELKSHDFVKIFNQAQQLAYSTVKKPVEGTILTLIKALADHSKGHFKVKKNQKPTMRFYFEEVLSVIKETVDETPNLLPALKEANVVDSGAFGLGIFIEGMIKIYRGEKIKAPKVTESISKFDIELESEFGFCTELIIKLKSKKAIKQFKVLTLERAIGRKGKSTVIASDEEIVKVHTHTLVPGKILDVGQKFGELIKIKIDNMQEQVNSNEKVKPIFEKAIISVSAGQGISKKLKELGSHKIVDGGQGANPSTKDFIKAINSINAEHYFLFPNNKNIFLAAKNAKKEFGRSKKITIVETKTMWEGINCLMNMSSKFDVKELTKHFKTVIKESLTIEITKAVKDTTVNKVKVKKGDYIGVENGKVIINSKKLLDVFDSVVEDFEKKDVEFAYVISGKKARFDKELLKKLEYVDIDCEVLKGSQDIYQYIIGGEK